MGVGVGVEVGVGVGVGVGGNIGVGVNEGVEERGGSVVPGVVVAPGVLVGSLDKGGVVWVFSTGGKRVCLLLLKTFDAARATITAVITTVRVSTAIKVLNTSFLFAFVFCLLLYFK